MSFLQSSVEQELLEVAESLRSFSDDMKASKKCVIETEYLDNFKELVEVSGVSRVQCTCTIY